MLGMTAVEPTKKKKKKDHPVRDWLLYALLRFFVVLINLFPANSNLRTARFMGRLLWKHYGRGRQRAIENLKASFPEKDEQWVIETGRKSFESLMMQMMEVLMTPRLVRKDNWREYCRFSGAERVKWMIKEHKGMLLLTAHYGNFEIVGYMLGMFGFDIYSVARPLDNKYVNDYLFGIRESKGQKLIIKKGASATMGEVVADGATLGFIADQDAGKKGMFVDFFGRKASTYKSIGLLAMMENVPVVVGCCRRVGGRFFFNMELERIIMPQEWADKADPLQWISQEYTSAIESFIRKDPTQYWWMHRRWKTRPKSELREAEAAAAAQSHP
jgi:Kdo2-lipid IVA lauroyltransferase/acyltransferase